MLVLGSPPHGPRDSALTLGAMPWRTTEPHLTTPHAVGVPTSFLRTWRGLPTVSGATASHEGRRLARRGSNPPVHAYRCAQVGPAYERGYWHITPHACRGGRCRFPHLPRLPARVLTPHMGPPRPPTECYAPSTLPHTNPISVLSWCGHDCPRQRSSISGSERPLEQSNPHTPVGDPAVCERFKSPQESQSRVAAKERTTAGKKYPRGHCLHAELIMSSRPLTHMHTGFEEDVVQKKKQHKI